MGAFVRPDGVPLYAQIRKSLQDDIANSIPISGQNKISKVEQPSALASSGCQGGLVLPIRCFQARNASNNLSIHVVERGELRNPT